MNSQRLQHKIKTFYPWKVLKNRISNLLKSRVLQNQYLIIFFLNNNEEPPLWESKFPFWLVQLTKLKKWRQRKDRRWRRNFKRGSDIKLYRVREIDLSRVYGMSWEIVASIEFSPIKRSPEDKQVDHSVYGMESVSRILRGPARDLLFFFFFSFFPFTLLTSSPSLLLSFPPYRYSTSTLLIPVSLIQTFDGT